MAYRTERGDSLTAQGFALHCRGDVRLYCGDSDCTPRSKKGRALLAVLAAEQRPLTRTKIIDLLWSDRQEEQARASLRTLLADLKSQFNSRFDDLLIVERERIALGTQVRTDLADPSLARPAGELFEGLDHIDPVLDEWLRVEREKWASDLGRTTAQPTIAASHLTAIPKWVLTAVLVVALAAGALLYFRPWAMDARPVIAVLAIKDVTGRNALIAAGLAEQLRVQLSHNPNVDVIGSQSIEADNVAGKDLATQARLLGASHLLEGRIFKRDGATMLGLRLYQAGRQLPIWSTYVAADVPKILAGHGNISDHVIDLVGEVAAPNRNARGLTADSRAWSDYFRAFELVVRNDAESMKKARSILLETIARDPDFAPALSIAAHATMRISDLPLWGMGDLPQAEARREARRFARRAIAAAPDYGPGYTALGESYYNMPEALPAYRKAVQLLPGSQKAHGDLAYALELAGDWQQALPHRRRAAQLNPLSWNPQFLLARALAATDNFNVARRVIQEFGQRDVPAQARYDIIAVTEVEIFGDWSNSYIAAQRALQHAPRAARQSQPAMWSTLLLFGSSAAVPYAVPDSLTALILKGDVNRVVAKTRHLGIEFWSFGYEASAVLHFLLQRGQHEALISAYETGKRGGLPLEMLNAPEIIIALNAKGRPREAKALLRSLRNEVRDIQGLGPRRHALYWAVLLALEGRPDDALRELRRAESGSWWAISEIIDHPYNLAAFRSLHREPGFRRLVEKYDAWVARERIEVMREAQAAGMPSPPNTPPPPFGRG